MRTDTRSLVHLANAAGVWCDDPVSLARTRNPEDVTCTACLNAGVVFGIRCNVLRNKILFPAPPAPDGSTASDDEPHDQCGDCGAEIIGSHGNCQGVPGGFGDAGGSWTRHYGDHEDQGFTIFRNRTSAHVTVAELGIIEGGLALGAEFAEQIRKRRCRHARTDCYVQLCAEFDHVDLGCPRTGEVLAIHVEHAGAATARAKIKEALGL